MSVTTPPFLPLEIIEDIALSPGLSLHDVVSWGAVIKATHAVINTSSDEHLWRTLFLARYDAPRSHSAAVVTTSKAFNKWQKLLQQREVSITHIIQDTSFQLVTSANMLIDIIKDVPDHTLCPLSRNMQLLEQLTEKIAMDTYLGFSTAKIGCKTRRFRLWHTKRCATKAQLHCLLGPSPDFVPTYEFLAEMHQLVYSLRPYGIDPLYTPFRLEGNVDWQLVEALVLALHNELRESSKQGESSHFIFNSLQLGLKCSQRGSQSGWSTRVREEDWAGVEGEWGGIYANLTAHDFRKLNSPNSHMPTSTLIYGEEQLKALPSVALRIVPHCDHPSVQPTELEWESSPVDKRPLFFRGMDTTTYIANTENITVLGSAVYVEDGCVRWRISVFQDEELMLRTESVQIGIGAAMGLVGVWCSDDDEDIRNNGSLGPFWFWKVNSEQWDMMAFDF